MMETAVAEKTTMTSESSVDKTSVMIERLDGMESPNNNNNTSASSSPKNERVASGLLKMLDDDSILAGLEDIPPSENLLDDPEPFKDGDLSSDVQKISTGMEYPTEFSKGLGSSHPSDDGSFIHSYSELSDNEDGSPLQYNNARQFELEFKLHEAEQKIEQLTLQLKGKSMQLEQVQVALISYEEEIMQLKNHGVRGSDESTEDESESREFLQQQQQQQQLNEKPTSGIIQQHNNIVLPQTPTGAVSLETAEQLSSKIIKLQQRVEELEDAMVYTKLDNAQLKETNDFLKSKLKQITKKGVEKKPASKTPTVRNLFARK